MLPKRGKIIDFCYNARRTYAKFGSGVSNIEKKIFKRKYKENLLRFFVKILKSKKTRNYFFLN